MAKKAKTPPKSTSADPTLQYALDVLEGKEVAGPLVRSACQRHVDDRATGESRGIWWDQAAADWVFGFFNDVLRLDNGKPFVLQPSQQFIVGSLFGWKGADGQRRFNTAYIETGKGSGKTPLAAGIGLYMLTADKQTNAEIYAAATDKDQAKVLFLDAVRMVDQSPAMERAITKTPQGNPDPRKIWNLAHLKSGSSFRPIASENLGRGKSGYRIHCAILDEIHEHPTDAMVEFMRKNLKGRPNSMTLMITNSGVFDVASVCWRYHEYSEKLMQRTEEDDRFFAFVAGLDKGDSWTDPSVWKKANPLLGVTIPYSYLEQEVREAQGMPSKQSLTRRLNFCEWVESVDPWIDMDTWRANGEPVNLESLRGRVCYGGLDLSRRDDLTALVFVFEPDHQGKKAVLPFFWKPEETLRQHSDRDRTDYVTWKNEGLLLTTPGSSINYEFIASTLNELAAKYQIRCIAFDPAKMIELEPYLNNIGARIVLKPQRQGYGDMDPCIQTAEEDLLEKRLAHGNHKVLTWCVNNAKIAANPELKRMFEKRKATGRIDGAVALAMACNLAAARVQESKPQIVFI